MAVPAAEEKESGDKKIHFDTLVAREQKRIFLLCLRLLRDRDEADSATQDVFGIRPCPGPFRCRIGDHIEELMMLAGIIAMPFDICSPRTDE